MMAKLSDVCALCNMRMIISNLRINCTGSWTLTMGSSLMIIKSICSVFRRRDGDKKVLGIMFLRV